MDLKVQQLRHPFHLVKPSPWPLLTSVAAFNTTLGAVMYMHSYLFGFYSLLFGLVFLITMMSFWWRDVVVEATWEGHHTKLVQRGLRYGMILFIVSEVMFFFAFFWAFFHSSLAPSMELGFIWPPKGIQAFCPFGVPLVNTLILLSSGVFVTWAHHSVDSQHSQTLIALFCTVGLGLFFTLLQLYEYNHATFRISDSIYGSVFFLLTGFHGFHVIIGTLFLCVCLFRCRNMHFRTGHYVGFESAIWYWHFVDVVWLFVFISVYWWGSNSH
jgi:heme/copper-type cytochrome/quinol oxidase subunit 3